MSELMLCHRCGFRTSSPLELRCPVDGLQLISQQEHDLAPRDPYLGTLLGGRYPVLGIVGRGGMGTVYRSRQPILEREVALKVIAPDGLEPDREAAQRFLTEARSIAQLQHPAVVTLFDFGIEPDGTLFMVMELIRGRSLTQLLRAGQLTCRELVAIALDLLDALDHAHRQGIIHRDLKPDNIHVIEGEQDATRERRAKLLDFGLAKLLSPSAMAHRTETGVIFGTPKYMSPEQAAGQPVDHRTDLYSLAAVLYEGLVGAPPFVAEERGALLAMRIMEEAPVLPPRPWIPPELAALLARALRRQPAERFSSASQMARALRTIRLPRAADEHLPPLGSSPPGTVPDEPTVSRSGPTAAPAGLPERVQLDGFLQLETYDHADDHSPLLIGGEVEESRPPLELHSEREADRLNAAPLELEEYDLPRWHRSAPQLNGSLACAPDPVPKPSVPAADEPSKSAQPEPSWPRQPQPEPASIPRRALPPTPVVPPAGTGRESPLATRLSSTPPPPERPSWLLYIGLPIVALIGLALGGLLFFERTPAPTTPEAVPTRSLPRSEGDQTTRRQRGEAAIKRAEALIREEEVHGARVILQETLSLQEELFPLEQCRLGLLLITVGLARQAIVPLRAALAEEADPLVCNHGLAQALLQQDPIDRPETLKILRKVLELDTGNRFPGVRRQLGLLYLDGGNQGEALRMLKSYRELAPQAPDRGEVDRQIRDLQQTMRE